MYIPVSVMGEILWNIYVIIYLNVLNQSIYPHHIYRRRWLRSNLKRPFFRWFLVPVSYVVLFFISILRHKMKRYSTVEPSGHPYTVERESIHCKLRNILYCIQVYRLMMCVRRKKKLYGTFSTADRSIALATSYLGQKATQRSVPVRAIIEK